MSRRQTVPRLREETPVDDVRRIRERFDREAGGDIHRHIEQTRQATERILAELGLTPQAPKGASARTVRKARASGRK
jgi:hypothetical protein